MFTAHNTEHEYVNSNWSGKYQPGDEVGGWIVVTNSFRCYSEPRDYTRYYVVKCRRCGRHTIRSQPHLNRAMLRGDGVCHMCHLDAQKDKLASGNLGMSTVFQEGQVVKYFKITKVTELKNTKVYEGVCQICGSAHRKLAKQMTELVRRERHTCSMCKLLLSPDELAKKRDKYYEVELAMEGAELDEEDIGNSLPGQRWAVGEAVNHIRIVKVRKEVINGKDVFYYTGVCQICQASKEYRAHSLTDIVSDGVKHCAACRRLGHGVLRDRIEQYYGDSSKPSELCHAPESGKVGSVPPIARKKEPAASYKELSKFDPDVLKKALSGKW